MTYEAMSTKKQSTFQIMSQKLIFQLVEKVIFTYYERKKLPILIECIQHLFFVDEIVTFIPNSTNKCWNCKAEHNDSNSNTRPFNSINYHFI